MRRVVVGTMLALLCIPFLVSARAATGDPPCPPGSSPDPSGLACVLADKAQTGLDAMTTTPQSQDEWLTNALELQHHLGDALPWTDAMWVGTHNSFNTIANSPPSLSNTDSNQHLSLIDQLDLGIRGIEIDVHWFLNRAVVCHARPPSEQNVGCTTERDLEAELQPVADWVKAHPNDVLLMYLEDNIEDPAGYQAAAKAIDDTIGDFVFKPDGASCPELPLANSRQDVLDTGKQVVIMSGCDSSGPGAWNSTVFDDSVRAEEGNPEFANCTSPSVHAEDYGTKLVRFYEDSTFISAAASGGDPGRRLTVDEIGEMVACGVNLFGLDQVDPSDPRLDAMVWSWAANEPAAGASCAVDDGRFRTAPCKDKHPYACANGSDWFVTRAVGPQDRGAKACAKEFPGSTYAVPGSGAHAAALRAVASTAVWLAYTNGGDGWRGTAA